MFSGTSFTVIFVNYKSPRFFTSTKTLRNGRDGVRDLSASLWVVVKGYVDVATFVVYGLDKREIKIELPVCCKNLTVITTGVLQSDTKIGRKFEKLT